MTKNILNVNDRVSVILTERGAQILNESIAGYLPSDGIKYKEFDRYESEMWNIMNIFGEYLYNGCEILFYKNQITIEPEI